jgi:TolB protein
LKSLAQVVLWLLLILTMGVIRAEQDLTIDITKGIEGAQPIAIVPFGAQTAVPEDMAAIISADLSRTGRFEPLSAQSYTDRPVDFSQINFSNWRALQVDHIVVGEIRPSAGGRFTVQFQLADVLQTSQLLGLSFEVKGNELRRLAHHISDLIYEKLTGERGAFNTRIAYITTQRQAAGNVVYNLVVADADGYNPQVILRSTQPLMSPSWSPDGSRLAYVSFENRRSQIVVQDVYSGARQTVAAYPGINGAPAWSPDGQRLAFTLSKDGNPEIYLYNLAGGGLVRLTNSTSINTEPAWSPDGKSLVFTSDRGGSPQLYRLSLNGGQPQRLTFEGDYNARPVFSPDGRYLAMVHRKGGKFYIAVMDMQSRQLRILTGGGLDESPSFAPNGRTIIYATTRGGRQVLAAVSVDGRVQQNLVLRDNDVREPVWSPYNR